MSSSVEGNVPSNRRGPIAPSSPFAIQVTKEALQKRIDKGDITQADVDILKKSYQWMTFSSLVGGLIGLPVLLLMKRRRPPIAFGIRLAAATGMGMLGSFLGFAVGGAAAALEVNTKMEDSGRKLKVFQQIVIDSQRAIEEARMRGEFPPTTASSSASRVGSGIGSTSSKWGDDIEVEKDVRAERSREADFNSEIGQIVTDAGFASDRPQPPSSSTISSATSSSSSSSTSSPSSSQRRAPSDIVQKTEGTWDKIRKASFPSRTASGLGGDEGPNATGSGAIGMGVGVGSGLGADSMRRDTRSKEQIEFDALLEKERSGAAVENEVWK